MEQVKLLFRKKNNQTAIAHHNTAFAFAMSLPTVVQWLLREAHLQNHAGRCCTQEAMQGESRAALCSSETSRDTRSSTHKWFCLLGGK